MRDLRIPNSSPPGDDGARSISPFRGRLQELPRDDPAPEQVRSGATRILVYLTLLALAAGGIGAWLIMSDHGIGPIWLLVPLAALAITAERSSIRLTSNLEVSISLLPTLFVAVVLGPLAAMAVSAVSMLGDFRRPYMRWGVYTCTRAITGAMAGLVAVSASTLSSSNLGAIALATASAVLTAEALDMSFASLTVALRKSGSALAVFRTFVPVLPTSVALYSAVVAPLAFAYTELSPWSVLFFLLPALAAQRLFAMYQAQRQLAADLVVVNEQLERANLSFARALVTTLDARDRYTAGHSAAVAVYALDIAEKMELAAEEQQLAHLCGLLHDIGKIGVRPGILEKNGPLTLQERREMEAHSAIGERILANVEAYAEIAMIVRHHHERVDGQGYPDGLTQEGIPIISRIICVADAYNAMTSDRPYRDAMPVAVARARLTQAAGTQFDPEVVGAFDEILETASETYSSGARADFALEAQAHPALSTVVGASAA